MDAPEATEITPEGYLYTGFGELMFFTGPSDTPVRQRLRTLERGYLPIDYYTWRQDGIAYNFTMFAATLDGTPEGQLVDFVRVRMHNDRAIPTRALLAAGFRYQAPSNTPRPIGDNRFDRPAEAKRLGDYRQPGVLFSKQWEYAFSGDAFVRGGKAMYVFPAHPAEMSFTLRQFYNRPPDLTPRVLDILPTTPAGVVRYTKMLAPGEDYVLIFKLPVIPVAPGPELTALENASFDTYHARTVDFWEGILRRGMHLTLPEPKVTDVFRASLIYDLIARNKIDGHYIQTVNDLHYHSFFLRDGSDIVHSYDVTGYPLIARQVLDFFANWQTPDGNFLSQPQQYDGWGETLWAYGQHYRITHDRAFAEQVFPSIVRAVAWLKQARAADPLHLMPASDVLDNEYVKGHITGYNFLALDGLHEAILMARALGKMQDAADFQQEYDDYRATFIKRLDEVTAKTGGYIPPALDGQKGGQDWGNLLGTYPEHVLPPHDPRITATLKMTQAKYQEGIMTYGDGRYLHHYLTIKNTLTEVIRGDQDQAVHELYALLLHTSSTQAGFEYAIRPWGDRNFEGNLSPHGWFAAEYRTLLRNMFVREDGDDLHLLSVLSPDWIGAGKSIAAANVPTDFGRVSLRVDQPSDTSTTLSMESNWVDAPKHLIVHLPWFMTVDSVSADGRDVPIIDDTVTLPSSTHVVRISWSRRADTPDLSYAHTVEAYKAEYLRRYNAYMHGAAAVPAKP
ncbi:MAG TPA: hypothetical protein VME86_02340 [Acidobacteriaceae bacterium]|nr:hypothetical protein [Acidobacteriaceae bacterium]